MFAIMKFRNIGRSKFRPQFFFIYFLVNLEMTTKNKSYKFSEVLKISLAILVEIVALALMTVFDSYTIYIINTLIKNNSRLILLCPKLYLGQNKIFLGHRYLKENKQK